MRSAATGVRTGSQPARRRREPFRDRQSHGACPYRHRPVARAGLDRRDALQRQDLARLRPVGLEFEREPVRWTPSFGPKSGVAKVEPAGSVLVVVVSCELGCRPGPGTRNGPTPVRGDGVQVAAGAPRSGVGAERRTWRRSSTPAPGAEAARALMRRGTSTSSHRTRPASDSPTTYAVARHCRSGSSARFPRAPRSANHRGAGRSPQT